MYNGEHTLRTLVFLVVLMWHRSVRTQSHRRSISAPCHFPLTRARVVLDHHGTADPTR